MVSGPRALVTGSNDNKISRSDIVNKNGSHVIVTKFSGHNIEPSNIDNSSEINIDNSNNCSSNNMIASNNCNNYSDNEISVSEIVLLKSRFFR